MLPDWVDDLANVLEILTFATAAVSWLLSRFVRTALGNWLVRPDIPVEQEITNVAIGALALLLAAALYVWSGSGPEIGLIRLMHYALLVAMTVFAGVLVGYRF